ncbi:ATP-binding cassette domain-containing protein [Candidatus Pacearchaeota archaeon]|nr:ATP-binding cassette domain-containing protein [Candidatus Pacearchaeota archaeon]
MEKRVKTKIKSVKKSKSKSKKSKKTKKEPIIELKNLWKTYHLGKVPVHALKSVDLKIYPGDFVIILGSSGSGKSTMMNMIGALDVPTKGKILLNGKDTSKFEESDLAQIRGQKVGFVFQQFNLMPVLSALQNVSMPMMFQDVPEEERLERAEKLLKMVGLEDRMTHRPTELSGGEQQRVAIARALSNDTEVLLADEPTGNLDSKTGKQIMHLISKLHKENGKTIVLVTHDINLVKYAHRTVKLKDGKVVMDNHHKPVKI